MSAKRIVHLSDVHLTGSGFDEDGVDAVRALDLTLEALRHVHDVDAVVVTGDLADDGSVDGCRRARDTIGAWATEREAAGVFTTGNHDRRAPFHEVFGTGHLDAAGTDVGIAGPAGTCAAVSDVAGLRVVSLDSLVPGSVYGELADGQLEWLAGVLAEPAEHGTVVAFHHPPVAMPAGPLSDVVLRHRDRLGEVLHGRDVRAVLTGHLHHALASSLAGVPVWVTPGVVTRVDISAPDHLLRGVLGGAATVVDLPVGGPPMLRVVEARDPRAGEQVYLWDLVADVMLTTDP